MIFIGIRNAIHFEIHSVYLGKCFRRPVMTYMFVDHSQESVVDKERPGCPFVSVTSAVNFLIWSDWA